MVVEKLIFKIPYEVTPTPPTFHPSDLTGGQLYLRKDQATVSSWISDIGTARNFTQGTATQQPTISTNSVDFDGVNDVQSLSEFNAFGSDTSGYIFFSGYFDNASNNLILCSGDILTDMYQFTLQVNTSGVIRLTTRRGGFGASFQTTMTGTTVLVNGAYYYGWVRSNGATTTAWLNGSAETITATLGTDAGYWWNSVSNRDNLSLGALLRLTNNYGNANINKIYYNNTALTSGELSDMQTFMSDPANY